MPTTTPRLLVASLPDAGHTNPLKPVARALVDAGHRVGWYAGRRFRAGVEATGAAFLPLPPELDEGAHGAGPPAPGRFQGDPRAERVAEQVHPQRLAGSRGGTRAGGKQAEITARAASLSCGGVRGLRAVPH